MEDARTSIPTSEDSEYIIIICLVPTAYATAEDRKRWGTGSLPGEDGQEALEYQDHEERGGESGGR